jgi:hypothetical protein
MSERGLAYIAGCAALLILSGGIAVKLATRSRADAVAAIACREPAGRPALEVLKTQSTSQMAAVSSFSADGSGSNVLELPRASLNFVGTWGGYTHSTLHSAAPGLLTGETPDRASIIFGRQDDTVFIAAKLYGPPNQRIQGKPRVRVLSAEEAIVQYSSEDRELLYEYTCRFTLVNSSRLLYRNTVDVYDRNTGSLVGTVKQHAILRRLLTAADQRRFARPSLDEVPQREIAVGVQFSH